MWGVGDNYSLNVIANFAQMDYFVWLEMILKAKEHYC